MTASPKIKVIAPKTLKRFPSTRLQSDSLTGSWLLKLSGRQLLVRRVPKHNLAATDHHRNLAGGKEDSQIEESGNLAIVSGLGKQFQYPAQGLEICNDI